MKAHIVAGGFGGLSAAALLIRSARVPGGDITIYEASDRMGGGIFLSGSADTGYNLPGSIFDKEYRCTFDLLSTIPSASNPAISVSEEFATFNDRHSFQDQVHIIDRNGTLVERSPRFGLGLRDRLALTRLSRTPERLLDGRRIQELFSSQFFPPNIGCSVQRSQVVSRSIARWSFDATSIANWICSPGS
jgi:oleate hydratase